MTILAIGSYMVIAAAAQTRWRSPRVIFPLITLGQRSYEVYLTHMFVVFALFGLFKSAGLSLGAVPVLFISVILISGVLDFRSAAKLGCTHGDHRLNLSHHESRKVAF
jgi:peptidoglycan/LPS O-acetylase OafA/YrhL